MRAQTFASETLAGKFSSLRKLGVRIVVRLRVMCLSPAVTSIPAERWLNVSSGTRQERGKAVGEMLIDFMLSFDLTSMWLAFPKLFHASNVCRILTV